MERRQFLRLSLATGLVVVTTTSLPAMAADEAAAKKITEKDILKDGMAATIANYCTQPEKQPNKYCPGWKDKPGHCDTCQFYNTDKSLTEYKKAKYARCQLLTDPTKPQFVAAKAWCATYVKKA